MFTNKRIFARFENKCKFCPWGKLCEGDFMKPAVLSFDLTGTLTTRRFSDSIWFEALPRLYSEKHQVPFQTAKEYLIKNYDELGEEEVEWYDIKYWFNRFGLGDGWMKLLEDSSYNIEFYPETVDVLRRCSKSYDLVLITNASRELMEREIKDIRKYFKRVISSVSDFREVKKTPHFYFKVCRFLEVEPREVIHIGDHWQFDFIAPRESGISAFYLDRERRWEGEFIIHSLNEVEEKLYNLSREDRDEGL